ncbi:MAG: helix-turn-helix domain-containing protein [Ignavibacteria bacterium]|nr:helix-turn-helix domain-containing protein [Ignavibacteria bacterium]
MKVNKVLNIQLISRRLMEIGSNQSRIAELLGVSREAVSKWFKAENLPSAGKLVKLAKMLDLSFEEIMNVEFLERPLVHYRKKANSKIQEADLNFALEMAQTLEKLVPYFPLNITTKPPVLQHPKSDYKYLNEIVTTLKLEFGINKDILDFNDLVAIFHRYNSIIIPVLWKTNPRHANALRIFLSESMSTWIYINLNTKLYDFKFWMAHELGHVLAPDLNGEAGEKFCDSFAGALLFPESQVQILHKQIIEEKDIRKQIHLIIEKGKEFTIAPLSVYYQLMEYVNYYELDFPNLKDLIFKFNSKFNTYFPTVSTKLFKTDNPTAEEYINFVNKKFPFPFFVFLKAYLDTEHSMPTFVQHLLDISFMDAQNIYYALTSK